VQKLKTRVEIYRSKNKAPRRARDTLSAEGKSDLCRDALLKYRDQHTRIRARAPTKDPLVCECEWVIRPSPVARSEFNIFRINHRICG
jgi:hypothetical protein